MYWYDAYPSLIGALHSSAAASHWCGRVLAVAAVVAVAVAVVHLQAHVCAGCCEHAG